MPGCQCRIDLGATRNRLLRLLRGHEDPVYSVAFSPDGRRVVSGSGGYGGDNTTVRVCVWDAETGECLEVIQGIADVASVAAGPQASPWRMLRLRQESAIENSATGQIVARFADPLWHIRTHPSGGVWAGFVSKHTFLIALEGGA